MITPTSPDTVRQHLNGTGHTCNPHVLRRRADTIRNLRNIGQHDLAERYGWLSLTALILNINDADTITPATDITIPTLGPLTPPTLTPANIPTCDQTVNIPDDPDGHHLYTLAIQPAGTFHTLPDGRTLGIGAIHHDITQTLTTLIPQDTP